MSVGRQFQLVYLLLERGRMTAGELAEKLEVSPRTVLRDVDALSAAGIPVYTAQGACGGVELMDGYVLDRAAFTDEERRQLLTALRALPEQEGEAALTKLSALFGRQEPDWLRVHLSRWGAPEGDSAAFRQIRDSILSRRALSFPYASARGETALRRVLPARLVFKGQAWYLQGFDLDREDYRTFRLTRILAPLEQGEPFHRKLSPPDIEPEGDIPPLFRVEARLRFSPDMAWRVYDEFGRDRARVLPGGGLEVEAVFPDDGWLRGYLLSFGAGVEVLAPERLRRELARMAREIYLAYAEPDIPCQVCGDTMGPSNPEEVPAMDDRNMRFCQSCGMPLPDGTPLGAEADGSPNPDYCSYCYQNGRFTGEMTMEQMIDFCAPMMARSEPGMTQEEAKARMLRFFPMLKRWKK